LISGHFLRFPQFALLGKTFFINPKTKTDFSQGSFIFTRNDCLYAHTLDQRRENTPLG